MTETADTDERDSMEVCHGGQSSKQGAEAAEALDTIVELLAEADGSDVDEVKSAELR